MSDVINSSLQNIAEFRDKPVDICVAFVLLWLAVNSDDTKTVNSNSELKTSLATLTLSNKSLRELVVLAKKQQELDLVQVFDVLNTELNIEEKTFLLKMAIAVASVPTALSVNANHILRFLADLLLGEEILNQLYKDKNGKPIPKPADLSSPQWWSVEEQASRSSDGNNDVIDKRQAYIILGVDETASSLEIKRAYRHLVQLYHPDRHISDDQVNNKAAEEKFLQVQYAYEVLKF